MATATTARPRNWREFSVLGALVVFWDIVASWCSVLFWTGWTRLQLSLLGCACGPGLRVDGPVVIRAPRRGAIRIGRNVRIHSRFRSNLVGLATPTVLQCVGTGRIRVGDHTGLSGVVLSARDSITIGQHVQMGGNVRVLDHDFHSLDYRIRRDPVQDRASDAGKAVVIGDDVFVGTNVIILKGAHIGERSVIGAGSVVAGQTIPPDSVVAGNPARVVRSLRGEPDCDNGWKS